jgi:protein-S-isoprenylcysteine O-methyltransferase Ste14
MAFVCSVLADPSFMFYPAAGFPSLMVRNIVLTLVVGAALIFAVWQHLPPTWGWTQSLGASLLIVGFVLWVTARIQLGASFAVTAQAKHLVTKGLYSRIRNPIYVFGSCVISGLILTLGHPIWLLVFVIIIPLQIWRAGKEARVLEAKFGDEYRRYRAGTWF